MPTKVKTSCCRSTPRCATCPVLRAARERIGSRAALVEEMLIGRPPRALPEPVEAALRQLSAARAR